METDTATKMLRTNLTFQWLSERMRVFRQQPDDHQVCIWRKAVG